MHPAIRTASILIAMIAIGTAAILTATLFGGHKQHDPTVAVKYKINQPEPTINPPPKQAPLPPPNHTQPVNLTEERIAVPEIIYETRPQKKDPIKPLATANHILLTSHDGIVTNIWIEGQERLDALRNRNIRYLFVDIGGISQEGTLMTPIEEIRRFIDHIGGYQLQNDYRFILLPYSEIYTYDYQIDEAFTTSLTATYHELIKAGFDGAFIDIEPVQYPLREGYLEFLEHLRDGLPEGAIIAAYAGPIGGYENEYEWNPEFYQAVSDRVDLIAMQGYDTWLTDSASYIDFVRQQTRIIASGSFRSSFLLGIPTHKESPETLDNALAGFREEIANHPDNPFIGVSIFAEWTITEDDWNDYDRWAR